jgi:hypothetical protein
VHGPSTFAAAINFSNAYTNPNTLPSSDIASFTTVDVSDSIQLARNDPSSLLHGMSVRVGATNLLGRYPPYAQTTGTGALHGVNYDVGNASPLGRVLNVQFVKKW